MTVQTNTNVANFLGNGAATYPIGFKFNSAADLVVQKTVIATGVTTTLTLNSDYSVAGAGVEEGGSITFSQAPTSAESIKVTRVVDLLQLTDLRNQGKFYAEVHEEVFDKLVMIDQQQQTEIDDANAKSDEAVATANEANAKSDQAVAKADQNLVDMQAQYDAFEQGASLVVIGDYAAGLVVDGYNKVFRKDGEFYRAKAELTLPYPLNGDWAVDAPKFVSVGDAVLRQDLAGAGGAAMIGRGAQVVDSIAALRTLSRLSASKSAFVTGYYSPGDGGGGAYYLDTGDTSGTDNGGTVIVGADGGRWKLSQGRHVSVLQFGAKADGSTDSSANVAAAISALGYAFLPADAGTYVFGGLSLAAGKRIYSDGKAYVKLPATASYGVRVTAFAGGSVGLQGQYASIEGIHFDGTACPASTTAIRFGTSSGNVFGFRGRNLMFSNLGEAIGDEDHATNYVVDVFFEDCTCILTRGRQVFNRRSRGFFTFRDFRIDHTYNSTQVTWGGAYFGDVIGLELEKFDVVGPVTPDAVYQEAAVGVTIVGAAGSASVWLRRLLIDNTRGPGLSINNITNVFGVDTVIFQNLGGAMELVSVTKSEFVNTKIVGGKGLAGAPASANGLSMSSCTSVTFNGLEVEECTGSGVVLVSCADCNIIGGYSNSNTEWGFIETTAATRNLRSGVRALSNAAGSLTQIGAQSATTNWWPNSGSFIQQTFGAATI